jgi:hypothetical protein
MQDKNLVGVLEDEIADRWASGIVNKSPDDIRAARERLVAWNRANPDLPIRILPAQIKSRVMAMKMGSKARFLRSLPREMRREAQAELEE